MITMKTRLAAAFVLGVVGIAQGEGEVQVINPATKPPVDRGVHFQRKDKDADGKLSKEEFVGTPKEAQKAAFEKRFLMLDKDGDGFLSREEFVVGGQPVAKPKKQAPATSQEQP